MVSTANEFHFCAINKMTKTYMYSLIRTCTYEKLKRVDGDICLYICVCFYNWITLCATIRDDKMFECQTSATPTEYVNVMIKT